MISGSLVVLSCILEEDCTKKQEETSQEVEFLNVLVMIDGSHMCARLATTETSDLKASFST